MNHSASLQSWPGLGLVKSIVAQNAVSPGVLESRRSGAGLGPSRGGLSVYSLFCSRQASVLRAQKVTSFSFLSLVLEGVGFS